MTIVKTGLISYWSMDEVSGDRADSHGSETLTDVNTVGSAAGKQSNAADFEASASEELTHADDAALSTGDIDFTFAAWVKPETLAGNMRIAFKGTDPTREWGLRVNATTWLPRFFISADGSAESVSALWAVGLSNGTWAFIVGWHDAANNLVGISVNDGIAVTTPTLGVAPVDRAGLFRLGSEGAAYWDGLIDEASFWKRVLTANERTEMYNSGNGITYSQLGLYLQSAAGSLTPSGALNKQTSKILAGALTPSGVVNKAVALVASRLVGELAPAGSLLSNALRNPADNIPRVVVNNRVAHTRYEGFDELSTTLYGAEALLKKADGDYLVKADGDNVVLLSNITVLASKAIVNNRVAKAEVD